MTVKMRLLYNKDSTTPASCKVFFINEAILGFLEVAMTPLP